MKPQEIIAYRLGAAALALAAALFLGPPGGEAGLDPNELPIPAKRVLIEVRDLMGREDYGGAVARILAFQGAESEGSGHPLLYLALGNCYVLQDDHIRARKAFSRAVEQEPGFVDAWLNLARTHYELKAYAEAARCYAKAYEQSGEDHPDYLYFSAAGYLMAGEYRPAIAAFDRLFKAHPGQADPQWQESYVHALLADDQPRRALPLVKALARRTQGDERTKWHEMLLHLYLQLDMPEQALSYAKALTRDNCIAPKWWKALAHVNLSLGRYEEALAALTIRGYLAPLSAEERKLWADLNLQMNIPIKAAAIYEEMIREKPDKRLLKNLVTAWQRLDRPEKGLEILDRIQPEVNDPEFLMLKGDLLYALKRFDAANRVYQRAAQFDFPQSGRAWLLAGYAAWQINDLSASCRAFENAAKHRRQRKAALLAMDRIRETQQAVR